MARREWSYEDVRQVTELWAQGLSAEIIAERLGMTKGQIVGKVRRLQLPARETRIHKPGWPENLRETPKRRTNSPWTPEKDALLIELWADPDASCAQIAKRISGVSRCAVLGRANRLNLPCKARPKSARSKRPQRKEPGLAAISAASVMAGTDGRSRDIAAVASTRKVKPTGKPCPLLDLTKHSCRWPIGDPTHADFHFCGARAKEHSSYCQEHHKLAYSPVPPRKQVRAA